MKPTTRSYMVDFPSHSNARQEESSLTLHPARTPCLLRPRHRFSFSKRWPDMDDAELLETNDVIANHPVSCTADLCTGACSRVFLVGMTPPSRAGQEQSAKHEPLKKLVSHCTNLLASVAPPLLSSSQGLPSFWCPRASAPHPILCCCPLLAVFSGAFYRLSVVCATR